MNTIITNNIIIYKPNRAILDWMDKNLKVNNPTYQTMKILGKEDKIKRCHIPELLYLYSQRGDYYFLPSGCLFPLWNEIKTDYYEVKLNDCGFNSIKNLKPTYPLYDYQEKAVQGMLAAKSGILVAQCAAGKTFMGIEMIRRIGKKALWLVHTGDLLNQAKEDMLEQYPTAKIGLTTKGKLEIGEDITISTIQTMDKIDPNLYKNEFDIVICDECAHVAGSPTQMKMFQRIISNIPARYKFGLTVTPFRSDGTIKSMYAYIGLSPSGLFEPTYKIDRSEVKTMPSIHTRINIESGYDDDKLYELYDASGMMSYTLLINNLCENDERTEKILENVKKCAEEGRKQVLLSGRVSHCEKMVEMLQNMGYNAILCVGKVSDKKRKEILSDAKKWDILVATYSLLKEGVSINELDTLHLVTPVKDKAIVIQSAGRIERYLEGKKQPIVYDYVDTDIPYCVKAFSTRKSALRKRF